jgi:hypothetical protein
VQSGLKHESLESEERKKKIGRISAKRMKLMILNGAKRMNDVKNATAPLDS